MPLSRNIHLSFEEVEFILGDQMDRFYYAISHCYCIKCRQGFSAELVNYKFELTRLNDIGINGFCKACNSVTGSVIRAEDNIPFNTRATALWQTRRALKELNIKRKK